MASFRCDYNPGEIGDLLWLDRSSVSVWWWGVRGTWRGAGRHVARSGPTRGEERADTWRGAGRHMARSGPTPAAVSVKNDNAPVFYFWDSLRALGVYTCCLVLFCDGWQLFSLESLRLERLIENSGWSEVVYLSRAYSLIGRVWSDAYKGPEQIVKEPQLHSDSLDSAEVRLTGAAAFYFLSLIHRELGKQRDRDYKASPLLWRCRGGEQSFAAVEVTNLLRSASLKNANKQSVSNQFKNQFQAN